MNIIAKRKTMSTQDAVQAIATVFADLEKQQRKAIRQVRKLRDDYQAIATNGDATTMSVMVAFAALDALVTGQYSETLLLHREQTEEAKRLGIDTGPMASDPDEEDGDVTILSGGDR